MRVFVQPPQPQASELSTPQEESVTRWLTANLTTTKTWASNTALAWDISPTLAVYLPSRSVPLLVRTAFAISTVVLLYDIRGQVVRF